MASVKLSNFEGQSVSEIKNELNRMINELEHILYNLSPENMDEDTSLLLEALKNGKYKQK